MNRRAVNGRQSLGRSRRKFGRTTRMPRFGLADSVCSLLAICSPSSAGKCWRWQSSGKFTGVRIRRPRSDWLVWLLRFPLWRFHCRPDTWRTDSAANGSFSFRKFLARSLRSRLHWYHGNTSPFHRCRSCGRETEFSVRSRRFSSDINQPTISMIRRFQSFTRCFSSMARCARLRGRHGVRFFRLWCRATPFQTPSLGTTAFSKSDRWLVRASAVFSLPTLGFRLFTCSTRSARSCFCCSFCRFGRGNAVPIARRKMRGAVSSLAFALSLAGR